MAWEGCISNDDELCLVERPIQVRVSFNNLKGEEFDMLCTGLIGRLFQHELDHINGELMWEDVKVKNVPRRLER